MITINSFLHRAEFYDLIRRWMYGDLLSSDPGNLTRLVHFNNAYISRYLDSFSSWLIQSFHEAPLKKVRARTKAEIKDAVCRNPPYTNERIEQLVRDYNQHPEYYYRETPFLGHMFFIEIEGRDLYLGSRRIKRVKRLAEKAARRIVDRIFEAIKIHAEALAYDRARTAGIPMENLFSEPEDMLAEFLWAEKRMQDDLKNHRSIPVDDDLVINDVAGIKVILEGKEQTKVLRTLAGSPDCEVLEVEPHRGNYNATNILAEYRPDKTEILSKPLSEPLLDFFFSMGMDRKMVQEEFEQWVLLGEDSVTIEVIISDYQEMMESEIGRCMHEDRIIDQRLRQEYRGHLSKNVEYLLEYIFAFAISKNTELKELPIKLWNRYLPDYFEEVIKGLYKIPPTHFDI